MSYEYEYCNCEQTQQLREAMQMVQLKLKLGNVVGCLGILDKALAKDALSKSVFMSEEEALKCR